MRAPALLVLALLLAGCFSPDIEGRLTARADPLPDAPADAALVAANTAFALDLARAVAEAQPGGNLVLSPFSVSVALAMAHEGADGATRAAMAKALRLEGLDDPAALYRALLGNETVARPNVMLEVADSLWLDEEFKRAARQDFLDRVARSFLAEVYARDFRDAGTVDDVNRWASDKTHGKVPRVLEDVSPDAVMLLLNAVYFKASWTSRFRADCTHEAPFTRADGSKAGVPMMCGASGTAITGHARNGLAAARLPYADGRFAAYVIMPRQGAPLSSFVAAWTPDALDGMLAQARAGAADVQLPRTRLKSHVDLQPPLSDLGMGVAFSDGADFGRIAPGLLLSRALHDAVLEVDEAGTVAAAVTTVEVSETSAPVKEPIVFDHPFVFVLRDDATGSILFVALVEDPSAG